MVGNEPLLSQLIRTSKTRSALQIELNLSSANPNSELPCRSAQTEVQCLGLATDNRLHDRGVSRPGKFMSRCEIRSMPDREQNDEIDLMEDKLARVKAYYKLHRPGILDKPRSSKYDSTFIKSEKEGFWRCLLCTGDKYGLVKIEPTGSTSGRLTHLERHHPVELMQLKKGWTAKKNRRGRPGPLLDQIKLFVASRDSESGSIDDIEAENNSSMELASSSAIFPEGGAQPNDEIFAAREIKTEELPLEEPLTRFIPNFSDGGDASPNRIDHAITEFIARDMVPLGVVEGSGFAALMRVVQPNYEVKGMRYYSNRVLPQLYERMKERVKTALDSASAVAFSSDVRSDDTGNSFLSCTAHCIDPVKLKPTHFAIGIFPFKKDGRISSIIFHNIMDCLKEFGVERERRLIFVLDPASNITATRIMLDLPVINCYTNSIELSIRQGIEKMEAGLVIEKIKMIVHRIRNSPAQKNIALACFAECNLPPEDASVKWITLYNSVTRFLENRHAVRKFVHANQLPMASEKEERMPVLSDEEWNLLFKVQKLLAPFTAMTKYLQPRPLAHLSVIIPFYQVIKTRMEEAGEDELSDARRAILIDLRSRIWDYMGEGQQKIVCIATFLDPRFKDRFFKDFIYNPKEYFVNAVIETFVPAAQNEIKQEVDMKEHESEVEDEFKAFARAHAPKRPRRELPESDEFRSLIEQEVTEYLSVKLSKSTDDPLHFWRNVSNQTCFPRLFTMAKVHLAAPATSNENERSISVKGNRLTDFKKDLSDEDLSRFMLVNLNYDKLH